MSKTFLHIGLHKTASTFLQDLIFPTLANTLFLSRPYTQLNHAFNKLQYADDTRFNEHEFQEEFNQFLKTGKNIFVSDEMLSGIPTFNYINRAMIAQRLCKFFPDATVILFLRSQNDIIYTLHNTWIRNLVGTERLESFAHFPDQNYSYSQFENLNKKVDRAQFKKNSSAFYFKHDFLSLNLSNFFYYELVHLYKQLFQDVQVFLFEDFKADPGSVIAQIENILGDQFVGIDKDNLPKPVNLSFSPSDIEAKRFRNIGQQLTQNRVLLKVFEVCGQINHSLWHTDDEQHQILRDRVQGFYTENNRKLIQTYPEIRLDKYPDKYQL